MYMVKKMEMCGLPQSQLDPCLFIGEKVICICYVDDLLFWARDEKDIHELAMRLCEVGVDLEQDVMLQDFWVSVWSVMPTLACSSSSKPV